MVIATPLHSGGGDLGHVSAVLLIFSGVFIFFGLGTCCW